VLTGWRKPRQPVIFPHMRLMTCCLKLPLRVCKLTPSLMIQAPIALTHGFSTKAVEIDFSPV